MPNYSFRYIRGQSAPSGTVRAASDAEAYKQIDAYLAERSGAVLMPGTIYMTEHRHVPDPPVTPAGDAMDALKNIHQASDERYVTTVDRSGIAC